MISKSTQFHCLFARSLILSLVLLLVTGCSGGNTAAPVVSTSSPAAVQTAVAQGTLTLPPPAVATTLAPTPSATPEPLALRVNGEGISIAEYQAELTQLQEAQQTLGKPADADAQRKQVLNDLTETLLLAQGAAENGFTVDDAALQSAIDRMVEKLGNPQALQDWIVARGYSEDTFRAALRRQLAAAWQRDQVANSVPQEAEQVHARQILTIDEDIANKAHELVMIPGTNFAAYAYNYDPLTGGDLGWFPRGYLLEKEVEDAAFALQPGEISPVIKSAVGYHIIQVISREPSRPLSPDARRVLQHKALQDWLQSRRAASQVEVLLP